VEPTGVQPVPRALALPHAGPIASPRAASILYADAGLLPRTAGAAWQIAPPCSWIPGLRARGTCSSFRERRPIVSAAGNREGSA